MSGPEIAAIAAKLDAWFIAHDGEEIDCTALARAAHSVMAGKVAELETLLSEAICLVPASQQTALARFSAALAPHPKGME